MKFKNPIVESLKKEIDRGVRRALKLTQKDGSPNYGGLWDEIGTLNCLKWTVKQQGYAIGSMVYDQITGYPVPEYPGDFPIDNKCSTQVDIESPWFRYWMNQLQSAPLPHRKLWEFAFILQNLHYYGKLAPGMKAIGFGCGEEPLASYFAARGMQVTVTDLSPEEVAGRGWAETGQHTSGLESAYHGNLVSREVFDANVSLKYVDMNQIPADLAGQYDVCWSVCALEHLGSIANGLTFLKEALKVLKPGGFSIHTTEFNYTETKRTVDHHGTVLFLRKHFEQLKAELEAEGHEVLPLNFDIGMKPLDGFVDLPPYDFDAFLSYTPQSYGDRQSYRPGHLKLNVDGFPATCIGFAVRKAL